LDNKKVKGTIHWVSAAHAIPLEVRIYDYLFSAERPMEVPPGGNFTDNLGPNSLEVITTAWGEPSLANADPAKRYQFERLGYFTRDLPAIPKSGKLPGGSGTNGSAMPVFNKTIGLRDTWAKIAKK
jgi:glutaminyl-tRNA synthetase